MPSDESQHRGDRTDRYPGYVDSDERPETTKENVPDDIIEAALSIATGYRSCPDCGAEQFIPIAPGHNSRHDCRECGCEMVVVG